MANELTRTALSAGDENVFRMIAEGRRVPNAYRLHQIDMAALLASSTTQAESVTAGMHVLPCCGSAEQMRTMLGTVLDRSSEAGGPITVVMPVIHADHWTLHQFTAHDGQITAASVTNSLGPAKKGESTAGHYPFAEAVLAALPTAEGVTLQEHRTGLQTTPSSNTCGDWAAWTALEAVGKVPKGSLARHDESSIRAATLGSICRMVSAPEVGAGQLMLASYDGAAHPLDKNAQEACDRILAEQFQHALNSGLDEPTAWSGAKGSRPFLAATCAQEAGPAPEAPAPEGVA